MRPHVYKDAEIKSFGVLSENMRIFQSCKDFILYRKKSLLLIKFKNLTGTFKVTSR